MAKLVHHDALVHGVQPLVDLVEEFQLGLFRKVPLCLGKRYCDFQLLGERQVDWKYLARFFPLHLARALRSGWSGDVQRCRRFVHGCVTQLDWPCKKRTATALRPSWYCTATTVASAGRPSWTASSRTRSSNSSGNAERKMACSTPPNSMTVASRNCDAPPRKDVTCTGIRTGRMCVKKRASCSAQSCSLAVSVALLKALTWPLAPFPRTPLRQDTLHAAKDTNFQWQRSTLRSKE